MRLQMEADLKKKSSAATVPPEPTESNVEESETASKESSKEPKKGKEPSQERRQTRSKGMTAKQKNVPDPDLENPVASTSTASGSKRPPSPSFIAPEAKRKRAFEEVQVMEFVAIVLSMSNPSMKILYL